MFLKIKVTLCESNDTDDSKSLKQVAKTESAMKTTHVAVIQASIHLQTLNPAPQNVAKTA